MLCAILTLRINSIANQTDKHWKIYLRYFFFWLLGILILKFLIGYGQEVRKVIVMDMHTEKVLA